MRYTMSYYESIYEISKKEDSESLRKKVNNPIKYSKEAVEVARKILDERNENYDKHNYLAEIARDVHVIKNIIVLYGILSLVGIIIGVLF